MELFDKCEKCGKGGTFVKKVIGTFIHLKQTCNNCNHMREWDSQPFIKNIPAGNILLSASILFGGGLPSKVICIHMCTHIHVHTGIHACPCTVTCLSHTHYYAHVLTDVTHFGSFWMCNLIVHFLQSSAFLFAANHLFCMAAPPVDSTKSAKECWEKAYIRRWWESWQSRTERQVWVLHCYGVRATCSSGHAAGAGTHSYIHVQT